MKAALGKFYQIINRSFILNAASLKDVFPS
jgi:hypothetical protein